MITAFTVNTVEGGIESIDSLSKQGFPKINVNLEEVKEDSEEIAIKFSFVAEYFDIESASSKVGTIKITGNVKVKPEDNTVDNAIKNWNEKHMLPTKIAEEVINGLNFRCSATGTLVAYSLGLIPPLSISQVKIKEAPAAS
ncbi:MAG: hypothetical protein QXD11_02730 [Candidatus Micrarchaeaceae archaeon]